MQSKKLASVLILISTCVWTQKRRKGMLETRIKHARILAAKKRKYT